jgi:hypothetical protein
VLSVSKSGLVVEMTDTFTTDRIERDSRVVALVNHPKEKSLAEGDEFLCWSRRAGSIECKDAAGNLRRLPRWVYVSER